jgi:hypothetical protein
MNSQSFFSYVPIYVHMCLCICISSECRIVSLHLEELYGEIQRMFVQANYWEIDKRQLITQLPVIRGSLEM